MIQVVIIDDEQDNIETLIWELKHQKIETEVLATFTSSVKAYDYLSKNKVDAIFLDIQMPKMSGFELLKALDSIDFQVVFVTAYDNFAIDAFKHNALDYLLKPIHQDELKVALERLTVEIETKQQFSNKLQNIISNQNIVKKIPIHTKSSILLLELSDLIYLEGNSNYTNLYFRQNGQLKRNVSSKTLGSFEQTLDSSIFVRTHRSYLVNRNEIKELFYDDGKAFLKIKDEVTLPISRSNKDVVFNLLA